MPDQHSSHKKVRRKRITKIHFEDFKEAKFSLDFTKTDLKITHQYKKDGHEIKLKKI